MSCKEVDVLLHLMVDGELVGPQAETVREHLRVCRACLARLELLRAEAALLESALVESPAPEFRLEPVVRRAVASRRLAFAWRAAAVFATALAVAAIMTSFAAGRGVRVRSGEVGRWEALGAHRRLSAGDTIRTSGGYRAAVRLAARTEIALDEKTVVTLDARKDPALRMHSGQLWVSVGGAGERITVNAPGTAEVRASLSEFGMRFSGGRPSADLAASMVMSSAFADAQERGRLVVTVLKGEVTVRGAGFEEKVPARHSVAVLPQRGIISLSEIDPEAAAEQFYWIRLFPDPFAGGSQVSSIRLKRYKYVRLNPFVAGGAPEVGEGSTDPFAGPPEDAR